MEGVHDFETYSLVVYWTTVRLMLSLSTNQVWDTRKLIFSNDFVQATLVKDFYLALPYYFDSETGEYRSNMVIKTNQSLYGMVLSTLYLYNYLKGALSKENLNQSLYIPACSME